MAMIATGTRFETNSTTTAPSTTNVMVLSDTQRHARTRGESDEHPNRVTSEVHAHPIRGWPPLSVACTLVA
jgi:hypothetical protein